MSAKVGAWEEMRLLSLNSLHHPTTIHSPVASCGGVRECLRRQQLMPLTTPRLISLRPTSGLGVLHAVSRVHQCTNIHASVQVISSRGQESRSSDDDNTEERDGYIERTCGAIGADEIDRENEITVSGK